MALPKLFSATESIHDTSVQGNNQIARIHRQLDYDLGTEIVCVKGFIPNRTYSVIGTNMRDCFELVAKEKALKARWFVDTKNNFCCEAYTKNGLKMFIFRVFKDSINERQKKNFSFKIMDNNFATNDLSKYTRCLGNDVLNLINKEDNNNAPVS